MTGFRALLGVIATFLLAFYWTLESERIKLSLLLLVPKEKRDSAREIVKGIEDKLSSYVIGQGVLCLVIGTMALIAYVIIGLPHALILAILAGIMEAVPLIGPTLGAVPAVLVALSSGRLDVLWVIVSTVVIQQLENNLLVPRIMDKAIGIRPLVTLLAMLGFGSLFGIVGVLVAIPLAAVIQLILGRFVLQPGAEVENVGRDKASVLRYQVKDFVEDIRGQVRRKTTLASADMDRIEDSLESIAVDLDGLLVRLNGKQEKEDEAIS
jgi:predicted PurR-regulated permease PerM